jgi:hypothetical protein
MFVCNSNFCSRKSGALFMWKETDKKNIGNEEYKYSHEFAAKQVLRLELILFSKNYPASGPGFFLP